MSCITPATTKKLERVRDGLQHGMGKAADVIKALVTAQHAAAVGRQMEVDQRPNGQLTVVLGPGLEGEEGIDVYGSDPQALLGCVVGVHKGIRADGVLLVAAVAGPIGG